MNQLKLIAILLFLFPCLSGQLALIKDINPLTNSSSPSDYVQIGNVVYFVASTNSIGRELWRTDGTESGTFMVKDIYPGPLSSYPANLIELNGLLYFCARTADPYRSGLPESGKTGRHLIRRRVAKGENGPAPRLQPG